MVDMNDEEWMDSLAGREPKAKDAASVDEMRSLRHALLEEDSELELGDSEEAYLQLRVRMQREGLLDRPVIQSGWRKFLPWNESTSRSISTTTMPMWRRASMVLPVLALLAVGVAMVQEYSAHEGRPGGVPDMGLETRSNAPVRPQVLVVQDVDATLEKIKTLFDREGIKYETHPLGLKVGVEAQVPAPINPALDEKLKALGIASYSGGRIVLELQPTP